MSIVGFLPIFAAALSTVVLGMVWFHPNVFGSSWMRMAGITPEMAERGKKRMPLMAVIALLAAMLAAWTMSFIGYALGEFADWVGAIELGIWCWLGFTAPPMLGMVLWEQKPMRYYAIVCGFWLVAFIIMALVLLVGINLNAGATIGAQ